MRVGTLQQTLDLHLIADLAPVEADHVAFVEDEEPDIVEKARVVAQSEVELPRSRDDVARADCVFVEIVDTDASIERRDRLTQGAEGSLERRFRLS